MNPPPNPPPQPFGGFGAASSDPRSAQPPMPAPAPYVRPPPSRPSVGLKILAVFQILWGLFGVVATPLSALLANVKLSKDPLQEKLHAALWEGTAGMLTFTNIVLGFGLAALLVATGAGLWGAKAWSRMAGIVYGAGSLFALLLGQVVMIVYAYPLLMDSLDSSNPIARAGAIGGLFGAIFGAAFGAIMPIITLVALGRPSVKTQLG